MKLISLKNLVAGIVLVTQVPAFALEVHEWGTFTSLVNENGAVMNGMYHEEEGLPGFVYGLREENPNGLKSVGLLASGCPVGRPSKCAFDKDFIPFNQFNTTVTQKMETPVIYFYGKAGEKAHVDVGFPDGMISQWFPAASDLNLHQEQFKGGHMSWDVTLKDPHDTVAYPQTSPQSIWNPARKTKANTIQVNVNGAEEERFIFYRGLGDFTVPLKLTLRNMFKNNLKVTVKNTSAQTVPAMFYILSSKEKGIERALALPSLPPFTERSFETLDALDNEGIKAKIKSSLINAGLFADEADSMLNTWDKSYFYTEGERLLYILPAAWTEKILPMKINPAPEKLNRVLVGRIELFSKGAQNDLQGQLDRIHLGMDHLLEAKLNTMKISEGLKQQVLKRQ